MTYSRAGVILRVAVTAMCFFSPVGCDRTDQTTTPAQPARAPASDHATQAGEPPEVGGIPRREGAIRIATYNVLNLFDDRDDPALEGREEDLFDSWEGLRAKPASQRQAVADAIRAIDADVLCLQEIEGRDALIEFRDAYLADMSYDHVASVDIGAERGIEQSVLSRFPLQGPDFWADLPLGGVHPDLYGDEPNRYAGQPVTCRRSPVKVTVTVPAQGEAGPYDLTLLVVHHKSGRYNDYWREREAVKFVDLIREIEASDPGANIAILGDFNAQLDEPSMRTYFDAGLTDARSIEPRAEDTYTHESGRTIDFILVNANLAPEVVPGSAAYHPTPMRPLGADWRTTPEPEGFASDHKPVVVDIVPNDR